MTPVIHEKPERRLDASSLIFPVLCGFGLFVLVLRLWYIQVAQAAVLVEEAENLRTSTIQRLAPRGLILDRKGRLVAGVRPEIVITAIPAIARRHPEAVAEVAAIVGLAPEEVSRKLEEHAWRPYVSVPVYVGATMAQATRIGEAGRRLPGFDVQTLPMRRYVDPWAFAHVVGYVWTPDERDVRRLSDMGLEAADYVGKTGVEYVYERELMGRAGLERAEIDSRGRPVRVVERVPAQPGERLVLSLDADLQRFALASLQEIGRPGAVAAIDPRNGEVLALVSYPSFDASVFSRGISRREFEALQADPARPQVNRAVSSAYSPGSTFKIVTGLAGLSEGLVGTRDRIHCPGYFTVGSRRVRCLGRHGSVTFEDAFAQSCNVYFCEAGRRAGRERIVALAEAFGLGEPTGIDLRTEARGSIPDDEYIRTRRNPPRWFPGDTINISIGQGELSATPLQMACLVATVANRGVGFRPRLVRARVPAGSDAPIPYEPVVAHRVEASPAHWDLLHRSMERVITAGTGRQAAIPGLRWGGKTGSSQFRRNAKPQAWFVGFAPLDDPRIAIAVLIEEVGHGGEFAAPVAAKIVRRYLRGDSALVQVETRSAEPEEPATSSAPAAPGALPR